MAINGPNEALIRRRHRGAAPPAPIPPPPLPHPAPRAAAPRPPPQRCGTAAGVELKSLKNHLGPSASSCRSEAPALDFFGAAPPPGGPQGGWGVLRQGMLGGAARWRRGHDVHRAQDSLQRGGPGRKMGGTTLPRPAAPAPREMGSCRPPASPPPRSCSPGLPQVSHSHPSALARRWGRARAPPPALPPCRGAVGAS